MLATHADVRREIERLLVDFETSSPRLLRFFQEYFEYTNAPVVFKDHRQANAIFARERVEDADELVLHVLKQDEQVLSHLLTDDKLFISSKSFKMREPVEQRYRRDLLPDYGFPHEWQWEQQQPLRPVIGRRSGMLTIPLGCLLFPTTRRTKRFNADAGCR